MAAPSTLPAPGWGFPIAAAPIIWSRRWRLVTIAFLMLKNNEPYRYAKPMLLAQKFAALDRAAGGKAPQPRKRQSGPTAQARAGLAAVYAGAGLPKVASPEELPKGEQRMLEQRELSAAFPK